MEREKEEEQKRKMSEMIEKLSRQVEELRIKGHKKRNRNVVKCFNCGETGHYASECSINKDSKNYQFKSLTKFCLKTLESSYPKLFGKKEGKIKFVPGHICRIDTENDKIVSKKGIRLEANMREDARKYIKHLEETGIIRKSKSNWRNPIRFLRKKTGKIRLVVNMMALNDISFKDETEIPSIKDILESTEGSKIFTVFDMKDAFHSIEIKEDHKKKTVLNLKTKDMNGIACPWDLKIRRK